MKPEVRRILIGVGCAFAYLFALVVFAYITFPYDRLKSRIVAEFNAAQTGPSPSRLELDKLSSYWFTGVRVQGVRLISEASAPSDGDKKAAPSVMAVDSAHVRLSLLNLLIFRKVLNFGLEGFGGSISGSMNDSDTGRTVDVEIKDLDLSQAPMIADAIGLPMFGKLSGTINLQTPEARFSKAEGALSLKIADLAAGDGKAKIRDTLALPRIDAGELGIEAEVKDGTAKITKFSATGPDLEFSADGTIRFRDQPEQSTLNLNAKFKFTDRFATKNDLTKALLGPTGLFDLDPKNKRAKQADGFYTWRVTGMLSKPIFTPGGTGGSDAGGRFSHRGKAR